VAVCVDVISNNMRKLTSILLCLTITGCTTASTKVMIDGVLGHYPHYDALEYDRAVQVEALAKDLVNHKDMLNVLVANIEVLKLYTSGRPYNERITKQVELLEKVVKELQHRLQTNTTVSKAYYENKCDDIVRLADNIRKTIGIEKL